LPDDVHGLAAPGMERVVNPPLDRVLAGSMALLRAAPWMMRISVFCSRRWVAKL
jgi:hypothetical protein